MPKRRRAVAAKDYDTARAAQYEAMTAYNAAIGYARSVIGSIPMAYVPEDCIDTHAREKILNAITFLQAALKVGDEI